MLNDDQGRAPRARQVCCCPSLAAALLVSALSACGGGGGGGSENPPPPPPSPSATLVASADAKTTVPGGTPLNLHATLTNSSLVPSWQIEGAGSLSRTTGSDVQYLPPDPELVDTASTVKVTVTAGTLSQSLEITLDAPVLAGHAWTTSRSAGVAWSAIASGDGSFVATGKDPATGDGVIYQSTDGMTWAPRASFAGGAIASSTWGTKGWVAVSRFGATFVSADGKNWSASTQLPTSVERISFGNGVYVAAGEQGTYVSNDGSVWSSSSTGLRSVAFGNGVFVGTGSDTYYSTDALHWTKAPWLSADSVAFGNGRFVAGGNGRISYSTDGAQWTSYESPAGASTVVGSHVDFVDGLFVTSNADNLFYGSDGTQWQQVVVQDNVHPLVGVAANGSKFVRASSMGGIEYSADLQTWAPALESSAGDLHAAAFGDGTYVAVSDAGWALSSSDRSHWQRSYLETNVLGLRMNAKAAVHGAHTFVACGQIGTLALDTTGHPFWNGSIAIAHSPDGTSWTPAPFSNLPDTCSALTYDGKQFVAATDRGNVLTSPDGHNWSLLASIPGAPVVNGLTFADGRYVAVGDNGFVASSADASLWTVSPAIKDGSGTIGLKLYGVTFDGSHFVLVGQTGIVGRSHDGTTWEVVGSRCSDLHAISFGEGELIAVGADACIESSRDGLIWFRRESAVRYLDFSGTTFGGGAFVAVGGSSLIEASDH